jgi:hypothetical protein
MVASARAAAELSGHIDTQMISFIIPAHNEETWIG